MLEVAAAAHSPLADAVAERDPAEFMDTTPALYRCEVAQYPTHAAFIAPHGAARP